MPWYAYLAHFFAGAFLANGVPHFVQGICGSKFQTPFGKPPGVGKSLAIVNVLWGTLTSSSGSACCGTSSRRCRRRPAAWPRPRSARWSLRCGSPAISARCGTAHRGREGDRPWPTPLIRAARTATRARSRFITRMFITILRRRATAPNVCVNASARNFRRRNSGAGTTNWSGPHTRSMYQIAFPATMLETFLPWLMLNRDGLVILLHPETGNDYRDHTAHAVWFGAVLPLRTEVFQKLRVRCGRRARTPRSSLRAKRKKSSVTARGGGGAGLLDCNSDP